MLAESRLGGGAWPAHRTEGFNQLRVGPAAFLAPRCVDDVVVSEVGWPIDEAVAVDLHEKDLFEKFECTLRALDMEVFL